MGFWSSVKSRVKKAQTAGDKVLATKAGKVVKTVANTYAEVHIGIPYLYGEAIAKGIKQRDYKAGFGLLRDKVEERIDLAKKAVSGDYKGIANYVGVELSKRSGGDAHEQAQWGSGAAKLTTFAQSAGIGAGGKLPSAGDIANAAKTAVQNVNAGAFAGTLESALSRAVGNEAAAAADSAGYKPEARTTHRGLIQAIVAWLKGE